MTVTTYSTAGTFTWPRPNNVTQVQIETIGAGAGGAWGLGSGSGDGRGGGAGGYSKINAFQALLASYSLTVGAHGTSTPSGTNGGDSSFNTSTCVAKGGLGTGVGGAAASGTGDVKYSGGNGGTPTVSNGPGNGGGSSGGSAANGNSTPANQVAGATAPTGGGPGGAGGAGPGVTPGNAPVSGPGGGGGAGCCGGYDYSGPGGNGADGKVIITYSLGAPIISSLSASSGPTTGGTSVVITGAGFTGATAVTFGGVPASALSIDSDMQITATTPPGAAGAVAVAVTTAYGTGSYSSFTYGQSAPTVTSLSPSSGSTAGGTFVTINGTSFIAGSTVSFGGNAATGVTINSVTQITCIAPAHAGGTVDVTVTNSQGTSPTGSQDLYGYTNASQGRAIAFDSIGNAHCTGFIYTLAGDPMTGNVFNAIPGALGYAAYVVYDGSAMHVENIAIADTGSYCRVMVNPRDDSILLIAGPTASANAYVTPITVAYTGTAPCPVLVVFGAGNAPTLVGGIRNERTGQAIYFKGLVLSAGETLYVDTDTGKVYSDARANLMRFVAPGSDLSNFVLLPGNNYLSILHDPTVVPTLCLVQFYPRHWSVDGAGTAIESQTYTGL